MDAKNKSPEALASLTHAYLRLAKSWREQAIDLLSITPERAEKHPLYKRLVRQIEEDLGEFAIIWQAEMLRYIEDAARRGVARGEAEIEKDFPDVNGLIEEMNARSPLQRETVRPFASKQAKIIALALLLLLRSNRHARGFVAEIEKLFGKPLQEALRTLLNEVHRAEQIGYLAVGRAYPEIVHGWVWETMKDDLVCPICWILDGQWFPIREPFVDHPHGRCYPRYANAPSEGGMRFLSLPDEQQRAVLGIKRYDLWKSGQVALREMLKVKYDQWGKHYVLKRIDELGV